MPDDAVPHGVGDATPEHARADEMTAGEPLRILLIDDHTFIREGTRRFLEDQPDLRVVGEASDGIDGLRLISETAADVVVLDIGLPGIDGITLCREVRRRGQDIRILILTAFEGDAYIRALYGVGADGYIHKRARLEELVAAIRAVCQGYQAFGESTAQMLAQSERRNSSSPTPKELEVLRGLARGLRNRELAAELHISVSTIEFHLKNLFEKFDVKSRTEALVEGQRRGLLDTHEPLC